MPSLLNSAALACAFASTSAFLNKYSASSVSLFFFSAAVSSRSVIVSSPVSTLNDFYVIFIFYAPYT